jgi:hypothetical protein
MQQRSDSSPEEGEVNTHTLCSVALKNHVKAVFAVKEGE